MTTVRGQRYCEVFIISGFNPANGIVYNTWTLNDCPANCWDNLTTDELAAIAAASGIPQVRGAEKNGPRWWVMDGITGNAPPGPTITWDCVDAQQVAILPLSGSGSSGFKPPYQEQQVQRSTTWTYNANGQMYMLVNPQGEAYVMQSFTTLVDPNLTIDQLPNLKSMLSLPSGWDYKVQTCGTTMNMTAPGQTIVLQDDLKNTYQKVSASQVNINPLTCSSSSSSSSLWWLWIILAVLLAFVIIFLVFYFMRNWGSSRSVPVQQTVQRPGSATLDIKHQQGVTITPVKIAPPVPPPVYSQVVIPVQVPPGTAVVVNQAPVSL